MNRKPHHSVFTSKIIKVVQAVPSGKVISYGQAALYIGIPRAARQVGWTLRNISNSVSIPWWRVVNNKGRISIEGNLYSDKMLQKKLLEQEGIYVSEDYMLDIKKHRFIADSRLLRSWHLPITYIEKVIMKYSIRQNNNSSFSD